MAESQKGASSTNDSTKKSPLLDDEIEGDFLNCCKTTTVSEDSLDFSSEMVPHGKKKTFNFDKMDMDFELDTGFDKISSFKLDMSDIDFSSPPRKAEKPNERSGKVLGKPDGKQERFKFSFDFNELDGFDLDSSLLKREKKSAKHPVKTTLDSPIKQAKDEDSINNLAMSIDSFERSGTKKIPILVSGTKLKIDCLLSSHVDTNTQKDAAPTSVNKENRNMSPDVATSLEKEITAVSQEESGKYNKVPQHRENSEMTGSTESHAEHALREASAQLISGNDSVVGTVPKKLQTGVCCLDADVDKTPCIESDNNAKSIASSQSWNSSPMNSHSLKHPPTTCTRQSQESDSELQKYSEDCNHVCSGSLKRNKPAHDNTGVQNGVAKSISQKLHSMKNTGENSNLNPNVLSSPFIRETRPNKPAPTRGKETSAIYSKCFSKSGEPKFQSHSPSAPKKAMHLGFNGEKRGNDAQDRNQKVSTLTSSNRPVAKGLSVILRSEKNDNGQDTPCFQAPPVNLPVHMTPSSTLKNINPKLKLSSIASITSPKITSLGRSRLTLNSDKKPCDIAGLKLSRNMMSKSEPSKSVQKETNAVKHSEEGIGARGNMASKVVHSMDMEERALFSPSLKRKSFEGSNVDPMTFNPLKRATESPTESRLGLEDSQRTEEKVAQNLNGQDRDVVYDQLNSVANLPLEASMTDLEVPLLIESDENVKKAETCAKELEDICNMLKKKHDEAKELLVRALVSNNLLLMLNHPIYEEKIRTIQRCATSILSREPQP